ncbi:MAG: hypothetical protein KDB58_09420, partial [Solirubrobacterales bacterium]|nr:hypothetical protein [Solirubrobacterales bacterium]
MAFARTAPLRNELRKALPERPFSVRFWDGTELPSTSSSTNGDGPRFTVRSPAAVGHALRAPGQLGVGRAYVTGDLEVDDIDAVMRMLDEWKPPPIDGAAKGKLALAALAANGLALPPSPPRAELRPQGTRRSKERDARSVRHHYDLPPEFFAL